MLAALSGVSCVYAYSVMHEVVAGATKAFMLYNKTTTATRDMASLRVKPTRRAL
jgi:hypothetical protein